MDPPVEWGDVVGCWLVARTWEGLLRFLWRPVDAVGVGVREFLRGFDVFGVGKPRGCPWIAALGRMEWLLRGFLGLLCGGDGFCQVTEGMAALTSRV